jgi:hypothetical protein
MRLHVALEGIKAFSHDDPIHYWREVSSKINEPLGMCGALIRVINFLLFFNFEMNGMTVSAWFGRAAKVSQDCVTSPEGKPDK